MKTSQKVNGDREVEKLKVRSYAKDVMGWKDVWRVNQSTGLIEEARLDIHSKKSKILQVVRNKEPKGKFFESVNDFNYLGRSLKVGYKRKQNKGYRRVASFTTW